MENRKWNSRQSGTGARPVHWNGPRIGAEENWSSTLEGRSKRPLSHAAGPAVFHLTASARRTSGGRTVRKASARPGSEAAVRTSGKVNNRA